MSYSSSSTSSGTTLDEVTDFKLTQTTLKRSTVRSAFPSWNPEVDKVGCFGPWVVLSKHSYDVQIRNVSWNQRRPTAKKMFKGGRSKLMVRSELPDVMRRLLDRSVKTNDHNTDFSLVAPENEKDAALESAYEGLLDATEVIRKALGR